MYKKKIRKGFKPRARKGYKKRYTRKRQVRQGLRLIWKPRYNNPLPQEYITRVRLRAQGFFQASAVSPPTGFTATGNYFNNGIYMNNMYQPLSQFQTALIPHINGLNWQTDPNCQPIGHQTLCNASTYRSYQVLATKLKWTFMPVVNGDRMDFFLAPNSLGATGNAPANITDIIAVPWNSRMCQANPGEKTQTAKIYVDIAKYLGVDKRIFRNDPQGQWSGTYNSAPTAQPTFSVVAQVVEHTGLGSPCGFVIEQDFYVRYYNLSNQLLL